MFDFEIRALKQLRVDLDGLDLGRVQEAQHLARAAGELLLRSPAFRGEFVRPMQLTLNALRLLAATQDAAPAERLRAAARGALDDLIASLQQEYQTARPGDEVAYL